MDTKKKILIVEDEESIAELEKDYLEINGFEVVIETEGTSALKRTDEEEFDMFILDLMLPGIDGFEICKNIREKSDKPVLMVSAKKDDIDKIRGLGLGADDYVTKPFSVTEVLARIKANIRRNTQYTAQTAKEETEASVFRIGQLVLNTEDFTLYKNGQRVEVTAKEFEILLLFMKHPKKVYTKEQLYTLVWKDAYIGDENAVNVHISRLRNKIEDHPRKPQYIVTVWGIGYKLGDAM